MCQWILFSCLQWLKCSPVHEMLPQHLPQLWLLLTRSLRPRSPQELCRHSWKSLASLWHQLKAWWPKSRSKPETLIQQPKAALPFFISITSEGLSAGLSLLASETFSWPFPGEKILTFLSGPGAINGIQSCLPRTRGRSTRSTLYPCWSSWSSFTNSSC